MNSRDLSVVYNISTVLIIFSVWWGVRDWWWTPGGGSDAHGGGVKHRKIRI